ncbi:MULTISPECIES: sporulation protein YqfC [Brevibacillus]|uniref:Sporulation protein YqfC n=1 Tax=Brevibacillus laterosporus TaxID=1465 RepID=A0AAP3DDR0_BRELA|nr:MULTISPECIES: sporulation protein YqfC [Brevibacillus]ATO50722.1 sporulation protein YqfC [Brevibacillus laterosporus DSM 25]AYB39073.1 sporulation protein YqfC [Brevibacillus laterosporus]MBG9773756.1 stage IV sporulation protein [Brevibacillus laterosporus]MBG9790717.1 stage IV sporulation protein [Brevibacillus laterosporus]MBG9797984.1 stage IV sporulation protein [Brevibacillus laterosporus]
MKKWSRRLRRMAVGVLDLPQDVVLEVPRITMIGHLQMYIENHRGVLQFSDTELRLLLTNGQLLVIGEQLVIRAILKEEVLLEGRIGKITFIQNT